MAPAALLGLAAGVGALLVWSDAFGASGARESGASPVEELYPFDEPEEAEEGEAVDPDKNVEAFLSLLRNAEHGGRGDDPIVYQTLFGGGVFASFADHPRIAVTRTVNGRPLTSTAAGAYQILARTWDAYRSGLPDFSPASQDACAVRLIDRRGALADVREGRFEDAVRKCGREWASLPGSPYGQPRISLAQAADYYAAAGGSIA